MISMTAHTRADRHVRAGRGRSGSTAAWRLDGAQLFERCVRVEVWWHVVGRYEVGGQISDFTDFCGR